MCPIETTFFELKISPPPADVLNNFNPINFNFRFLLFIKNVCFTLWKFHTFCEFFLLISVYRSHSHHYQEKLI